MPAISVTSASTKKNKRPASSKLISTKPSNDELTDVLEDIANVHKQSFLAKSHVAKQKNKHNNSKHHVNENSSRSYRLVSCEDEDLTQSNENCTFSLEITIKQHKKNTKTLLINPGDYIEVTGGHKQKNFIAKALRFYKNSFTGDIQVSVRWFYHPGEIRKKLLPNDVHHREVFYGHTSSADNINAETISGLCSVSWMQPGHELKSDFQEMSYFYRRSYNGKTVKDMLSPESSNDLKKSGVEKICTFSSPKRIRQTPSKLVGYEHEKEAKRRSCSSVVKSKTDSPEMKVLRSAKKCGVKKKASESASCSAHIEDKTMTSPISASTYGRFEASAVALDILSGGEIDDDDDDVSVSSKTSDISKTLETRITTKSNEKPNLATEKNISEKKLTVNAAKRPTNYQKNSGSKKVQKLVISIPRVHVQQDKMIKLRSGTPMRSPVSKEPEDKLSESGKDSDSEYETGTSESSSDESFNIQLDTAGRRSSTRLSNKNFSGLNKSAQRIRNKNTVTPIVIKMPRDKLPFIPARPTPVRPAKGKLEIAREQLHVSAVPDCLPCRETEFQEIFTFVEGKIRSGGGGCIYVSGVPGTGKTATVREVMNLLKQSSDEGDIAEFKFIDINGMRLTEPRQVYVQLLQQLTNEKATTDHASDLLSKLFSQRRRVATVVLADELDLLWTKKQDVLYHLFDWPTHRHARLIVVAIANTMDLPERILMNRVASRLGLTRLTFRPYTFKQLQEIVTSRLDGMQTFEADAIQLASRKVAAVSGDARRCLDICRRATEIAERSVATVVTIEHVHSALQEMFATPMIKAIHNCSKQEQLFLHSIVAEFRRSGVEEATLGRVIEQHTAISQLEGAAPVSVSTLVQICHRLASNRLIMLEGGQRDLFSRVRLNVSVDDVLFALK